jgi:hypothetical protein
VKVQIRPDSPTRCGDRHRRRLPLSPLVRAGLVLLLASVTSRAPGITFTVHPAPPQVVLLVGEQAGLATVDIEVPSEQIGNGVPIAASRGVRIVMLGRRSGRTGAMLLSVDSSVPLSNGTHLLPLSDLFWRSERGSVPEGAFTNQPAQVLLRRASPRARVEDTLQFFYANRTLLAPGTYTGSVTYTVALP